VDLVLGVFLRLVQLDFKGLCLAFYFFKLASQLLEIFVFEDDAVLERLNLRIQRIHSFFQLDDSLLGLFFDLNLLLHLLNKISIVLLQQLQLFLEFSDAFTIPCFIFLDVHEFVLILLKLLNGDVLLILLVFQVSL
jgi:hypothetical protein